MVLLLVYVCVLLALYLAPLTISSPCIMDRADLKPRPAVIGRRGAPMVTQHSSALLYVHEYLMPKLTEDNSGASVLLLALQHMADVNPPLVSVCMSGSCVRDPLMSQDLCSESIDWKETEESIY